MSRHPMAHAALKHMKNLEPGWDSYGAKAINERCIMKARLLLALLSGNWQPVPCADGGVQLEQHENGLDIEITISPASAPETKVIHVRTFTRVGAEMGMQTMCTCGAKMIDHAGNACVCPTVNRGV